MAAISLKAPFQSEYTPTMADVEKAGRALAEAGVDCVLLFGSVARGDQGPGSDIDLLAVYNDLDYTQRFALRHQLEELASQAAGCEVQVSPTDRVEWRHRSQLMRTTIDRLVAADAITVYDRSPGDISWDKEIGLPSMDIEEAIGSLWNAGGALTRLTAAIPASDREQRSADRSLLADRRFAQVCGAAHDAIEHGLWALIHATGDTPVADLRKQSELRKHRLMKMSEHVEAPTRYRAETILRDIANDDGSIPNFHNTANYLADIANPEDRRCPTAARAGKLAHAALRMAELARTAIEQVLVSEALTLSESYQHQMAEVQADIFECNNLVCSTDMASGMRRAP